MPINVLLVTHGRIGEELLKSASSTFGDVLPTNCKTMSVSLECDPAELIKNSQSLVDSLIESSQLLILTDLFGATPSNIACHYADHPKINIISGVNLPMLIRVLNYSNSTLDELLNKAINGGREGILVV